MKPFALAALALSVFAATQAPAASGRDIAITGTQDAPACSACHGAKGEGQAAAAIPRLAGLDAGYIFRQLTSFADGTRKNDTMRPVASALSDVERKAVAVYYASQKPAVAPAPAASADTAIAAGAALAQSGDWSRGIPGCSQCHGPDGSGVGALVPRLAGQSAQYIEAQLKAWRAGTREDDPMGLMASVAKKLDDTEIGSVAAYFAAAPSIPSTPTGKPETKANEPKAGTFVPPPENAIPDDEFGKLVRLGANIFRDTQHYAAQYVGNTLACQNCHLDGGRMANSAPLWAAYVSYPAYRSKTKEVNTYEERLQGCFLYSMNGKAPALGSKTLVALEAYSFFLAKGAPVGVEMPGRGYPALKKPAMAFDYARGEQIYKRSCALCHGANGEGQKSADGRPVFPALWGAKSFNWGAGMGNIKNAAGFIKANMPFSQGATLSDQEAWDVAAFVDSHERPQDPRFTGSVAGTRQKYHDGDTWMYGREVNGVVLGAHSPPAGHH